MNTADLGPPDLSLEWKRDAFNDEQHRLLNQKVLPLITSYNNSHPESRPYLLFLTLVETLEYAREVVPSLLTPDYNTCKSALQIPGLREMLEEDIERCDLKRTCSLVMFQNTSTATLRAWEHPYRGTSDSLLNETMQFRMANSLGFGERSMAIIQSSGTGKSRMNDQLAKQIVYIPMVLTRRDNVFPPADAKLTLWILEQYPYERANDGPPTALKMHMFLKALMTVAADRLRDLASELALDETCRTVQATLERLGRLASAFRQKLAEGRDWGTHGPYRISFYQEVMKKADEWIAAELVSAATVAGGVASYSLTSLAKDVASAATALHSVLNPSNCEIYQPLLVLCFDEAQSLAEGGSSRYDNLRYALHCIAYFPFFSVFISTSESIQPLPPPPTTVEPSARISIFRPQICPPFTETGYDELAIKVDIRGTWSLGDVATTEYMCHLGRPLFGTTYDSNDQEIKNNIVRFAAEKLICAPPEIPLNADMTLACLSVLLGLEYRGTGPGRQAESKQMERHLRICLDGSVEAMHTVPPSEPILAEGALLALKGNYASALNSHFQGTYLCVLGCGEVIAALLVIKARQEAVSVPVSLRVSAKLRETPPAASSRRHPMLKEPVPNPNYRVLSLLDFLHALLHPADFETVCNSFPNRSRKGEDKCFKHTFGNSWVYFNHCIKTNNFNLINQRSWLRAIPRGSIIVFANHQRGVDLIIPVTFEGTIFRPDNITAVLIQATTERIFTDVIGMPILDLIDPVDMFLDSASPLPVVRMMFALGSPRPGVSVPAQATQSASQSREEYDDFTAFDIWCAGCRDKTFKVIQADENETYQSLLDRTSDFASVYCGATNPPGSTAEQIKLNAGLTSARRAMYPGATSDAAHWRNYVDEPDDSEEDMDDMDVSA